MALAVDEVEPNNPIQSAQRLTVGSDGTVTVNGVIGNRTGSPIVLDADFYSFDAREGDVVTIDIDGAWRGLNTGSLDSVLTLFGPAPTYQRLRENDDPRTADPGSIGTPGSATNPFRDARLDNVRLPATGTYYVAVSPYNVFFNLTLGTYRTSSPRSNGPYTLIISGVTPPILHINIEIKPGSGDSAPVKPKAKGTVPVALLGAGDFDPFKIDVASLRFGANGDEQSLHRCGNDPVDVNGDGRMDRVCHFDNELAKFVKGDLEATLRGQTTDGRMFEGTGLLKVVPEKRDE